MCSGRLFLTSLIPFYREKHQKVNITWNSNQTVTYRQIRWWHFDPDSSIGTLKDNITTLNVVALVCCAI
jgi:hypothetical protein